MKKGRTRCKKLLCWLLVAAMVFTSGLSGLEVKAAGIAEVTEDTVEVSESTGESAQESEPVESSSEESERNTESAAEDDTESSTEENAESEESEATTESVTDETESEEAESEETETKEEAETEETETEESDTEENTAEEPIAYLDGTEEYGTLLNGDFETDAADGAWTYDPWTITLSESGSNEIKQDTGDGINNATRYLNIWSSVAGSTLTVSQSVNNIKPGTYKASVQTAGDAAEGLTFSVKTENETLASTSIGSCGGWHTWNTVTTAEFTVEDDSTTNLTIEISGTPENTGSWYIQLDNITLEEQAATYTKEQLQTLYAEHTKQPTATIKMWEA